MFKINRTLSLYLLAISIVCVYSHTIHYPFFFDDTPNITAKTELHSNSLFDIQYKKIFFKPDGNIGLRPISYLSFSLNWILSGEETWSYHFTNITIHILASFFLLNTILLLFRTPVLRDEGIAPDHALFCAVLTSFLWALHPIQTQAVTYIVQRMASMAGMFCILSLFYYIKARVHHIAGDESKPRIAFLFFLSFLFFGFGFLSKETTAILPLIVFLLEFIFFESFRYNKKFFVVLVLVFIGLILSAELLTAPTGLRNLMEISLSNRPFTLIERLLTEFRVVFFYITQIFYPIPQRFSLLHEPQLSTSLFSPVSTFFCLLAILSLVVVALIKKKQYPLISFAILFYFSGHLIESTIIPLEIVFEHRNYLPSMFVFLPVSFYFYKLIQFYRIQNKRWMQSALCGFLIILMVCFGVATYLRNSVWSSQKTLWENSLKHADSMRAWHNLAFHYYAKTGQKRIEEQMYLTAIEKRNTTQISGKILTYTNLANLYYQNQKYKEAEKYFKKAIDVVPDSRKRTSKAYMGLSMIECERANYTEALRYINKAIDQASLILYFNLKGIILMNLDRNEDAFETFKIGLKREPHRWEGYHYVGNYLTQTGHFDRGDWFIRQALTLPENNRLKLMLYRIQNRVLAKEDALAMTCADQVLKEFSYGKIIKKINLINNSKHVSPPLGIGIVLEVLEKQFNRKSKRFKRAYATG
jgi:protein O-mannosyl-transferase